MTRSDLATVDDLCRLAVEARRLGCHIHLHEPDRDLWELLDLAGVADVVRACPVTRGPSDPDGDSGGLPCAR